MPIVKMPIISSLYPYLSAAGVPTTGPTVRNGTYTKYGVGDSQSFITQRFPINIFAVPDGTTGYKGRGAYSWNPQGTTNAYNYFVNGNTVYLGNYNNPLATTITNGNMPVKFIEVGNFLILVNTQSNEVFYIEASATTTLIKITTGTFPFNAGYTLAGGGAELNGILYLMDTLGNIWNCVDPYFGGATPNTAGQWNGTNFINASRSTDGGVYLASHHNSLVAIGQKTIEVFYDAGNPIDSPLARRDDAMYSVGAVDKYQVAVSGDTIVFLGASANSTVTAYVFQNFESIQIGDDAFTRYINNMVNNQSMLCILGCAGAGEHTYVFMTFANGIVGTAKISPKHTVVYDVANQQWSSYDTAILSDGDDSAFPVVSVTSKSQYSNYGIIAFSTGDVGSFDVSDNFYDSKGELAGYWSGPYITPSNNQYIYSLGADETANIEFSLTTSASDFDTRTNKFCAQLSVMGGIAPTQTDSDLLSVSWSDDGFTTFSTPRTLDFANYRTLTRLGKFRERAFKFDYSGQGKIEIVGYTLNIDRSDYA